MGAPRHEAERRALEALGRLFHDKRLLAGDESGTPAAFLALVSKRGELAILSSIPDEAVLVEYPFGALWAEATGCARFVQLRSAAPRYALVRGSARATS